MEIVVSKGEENGRDLAPDLRPSAPQPPQPLRHLLVGGVGGDAIRLYSASIEHLDSTRYDDASRFYRAFVSRMNQLEDKAGA